MKLGKVIRELDVEPDGEPLPTPERLIDVPGTPPSPPATVPA